MKIKWTPEEVELIDKFLCMVGRKQINEWKKHSELGDKNADALLDVSLITHFIKYGTKEFKRITLITDEEIIEDYGRHFL